jgi:hypothetical protein
MDWHGINGKPTWPQHKSPTTGAPLIVQDNVLSYQDYHATGLGMFDQDQLSDIQTYTGYQHLRADLVGQQTFQAVEMRTIQQLVPEIGYVQMQVQVPQIEYVPVATLQHLAEAQLERSELYVEPPPERRERAQSSTLASRERADSPLEGEKVI